MKLVNVFSAVFIVLALPASANARTWYVTPYGSGDAMTIQAGIDLASTGDVVLVAPGTYTNAGNWNLDFGGKNLTLRSEAGPGATTINCGTFSRGLYFHSGEGATAVVEGFTIKSGYIGDFGIGAGIYSVDSSPTIINCILYANTAMQGAGMYCSGGSPTITNCTFLQNHARDVMSMGQGIGGGILCGGSSLTVTDCVFSGNMADEGGGGSFYECQLAITGCTFSGNSAFAYGGGIDCAGGSVAITNSTFSENSCSFGAGFYSWRGSPSITSCTFAGDFGTEIYSGENATLERTIVAFSTGQAVSGTATLTCCDIYGNAVGDWVGSIAGQYGINNNISADPVFCGPLTCPEDPYRLDITSPCAYRNSPCGNLIGARPAGCSQSVGTEPVTWGRVKAVYR